MSSLTRSRRRAAWAAGVGLALLFGTASPAAAEDPGPGEPPTLTRVVASGTVAQNSADLGTWYRTPTGATLHPLVMSPPAGFGVIAGSRWVRPSDIWAHQGRDTLFWTTFDVPPEGRHAGTAQICVLADNAATVRLNGRLVGEQPLGDHPENYQGDPDCFTYTGRFPNGQNQLEFLVHDYGDLMALDYRATMTFRLTPNTPPVLELPDDVTVLATDAGGAGVEYVVTATDADGWDAPAVACDLPSGGTFPVGATTVTCAATDDEGAVSTGSFVVTVEPPPNVPPALRLPADLSVLATGPAGATAHFDVTATDPDGSGEPVVTCTPASGSTFPIGTTSVECAAVDEDGARTSGTFAVTVVDPPNTPPVLQLPTDMTTTGTGPDGAVVSYAVDVTDDGWTPARLVCLPEAGSTFPVGTTPVTCTATDDDGAQTTGTFRVTVEARPNTPPVVRVPAPLTVDATGPDGAAATFEVAAEDDLGATVACDRDPGTFPIGVTTVTCTATDADGATATGSFPVTVRGAREQLADLLADVVGVGPGKSLAAKVRTAVAFLPDRALPLACEPLASFVQQVQAQSGRHVPVDRATELVTDATRIRAVLACG